MNEIYTGCIFRPLTRREAPTGLPRGSLMNKKEEVCILVLSCIAEFCPDCWIKEYMLALYVTYGVEENVRKFYPYFMAVPVAIFGYLAMNPPLRADIAAYTLLWLIAVSMSFIIWLYK